MNDDPYAHLTEPAAEMFARLMPASAAARRPAEGPMTFGGRVAFGDVWNRPHLSLRERRIVTIGIVALLARESTIRAHVGGALQHGDLSAEDLGEFAAHLAIYTGIPLASAFRRLVQEEAASYSDERGKEPGT